MVTKFFKKLRFLKLKLNEYEKSTIKNVLTFHSTGKRYYNSTKLSPSASFMTNHLNPITVHNFFTPPIQINHKTFIYINIGSKNILTHPRYI